MKIVVEFLLKQSVITATVSRVPCVGEHVVQDQDDDEEHEVKTVFHHLDADPKTDVVATVRVT